MDSAQEVASGWAGFRAVFLYWMDSAQEAVSGWAGFQRAVSGRAGSQREYFLLEYFLLEYFLLACSQRVYFQAGASGWAGSQQDLFLLACLGVWEHFHRAYFAAVRSVWVRLEAGRFPLLHRLKAQAGW